MSPTATHPRHIKQTTSFQIKKMNATPAWQSCFILYYISHRGRIIKIYLMILWVHSKLSGNPPSSCPCTMNRADIINIKPNFDQVIPDSLWVFSIQQLPTIAAPLMLDGLVNYKVWIFRTLSPFHSTIRHLFNCLTSLITSSVSFTACFPHYQIKRFIVYSIGWFFPKYRIYQVFD